MFSVKQKRIRVYHPEEPKKVRAPEDVQVRSPGTSRFHPGCF